MGDIEFIKTAYNIWCLVKPLVILATVLNSILFIFFHTRIKKYPEKILFLKEAKKTLAFWILMSLGMLIFMEFYSAFIIK